MDEENIMIIKDNSNINFKKKLRGISIILISSLLIMFCIAILNNYLLLKTCENMKKDIEISKLRINEFVKNEDSAQLQKSNLNTKYENLKTDYNSIKNDNEKFTKQFETISKQNEELKKGNRELIDDNIALQNSLKKAAAIGIKPQNYSNFEGFSSRGSLDRGRYLGKFKGTAYTPSNAECGNDKGITSSGKPIVAGITVAVDKAYWPLGTVFYIKGLGYAVAMDTGGAIKGKNRFDIAVFNKKFANKLGSSNYDVYLVRIGTGKVENNKF